VKQLLHFALDGNASDNVALQAVIAALDRAGFSVKQAMELSAAEREPAPWEEIMGDIALEVGRITRAEHEALKARARYGVLPDEQPALATPEPTEVVDAELVPLQEPPAYRPSAAVEAAGCCGRVDPLGDESATSTAPVTPPPRLLTQDEAAAVMRASRVRTELVRRSRGGRRRVR
jgi:hypothetical protein